MNTEIIRKQITDSAGNVLYSYSAHWIIVKRMKKWQTFFKVIQIILTALSTGGFLTVAFSKHPYLAYWIGGLSSATSLAIHLCLLNFDMPDLIKKHTDAANDLWDVREDYKTLLIDYDLLDFEQIRCQRDHLKDRVSEINKKYPETDDKSFLKAKKSIGKYVFEDGEAARLFHMDHR